MISKPTIMRRGEYKCRIMEMHWQLRHQQLVYIQTTISKPHGKHKQKVYNRYKYKKEKTIQTQH